MRFTTIKVLLILSAVFIARTVEQEAVDCTNSELVTSVFNDPVDLIYEGTIRIYSDVIINNIITTKNNDFEKNYIDAKLEEQSGNNTKSLLIYTTLHFPNYALEQSATRITLRVTYGCDNGRQRTLVFYQPFTEGNYFRPEFSQSLYELVVPTPLFAGFDLSTFKEISAKDDDLINNEIQFSSVAAADHFIKVTTKPEVGADKKTYFAQLTLERINLALATEIKFNITATDSGNPPLSSEATVILRADPTNSLQATPRFEQLIYGAALNDNLEMVPFEVKLQQATYSTDVTFLKMGRDQLLFEIASADNVLEVRLARKLEVIDIQNKDFLEFEIKADNQKLTEFGQTAIMVHVPHKQESFRFIHPMYEGDINDQGELNVPSLEFNEAAYDPKIEFALHGVQKELFLLQQEANKLQLELNEQFKLEDWRNQSFFSLKLNATLKEQTATTAIFIKLPTQEVPPITSEKQPQFEKPQYVGKLSFMADLQLETMRLVENTYEPEKTQYSLAGDAQDLFEIVAQAQQVELRLKRTPTSEELSKEFAFLLVLTAKNNELSGATSIVIELPVRPGQAWDSIFEQSWQTGSIDFNAQHEQQLSLNGIKLGVNVNANEFVFVLEGAEAEYFAATVNAAISEVNLLLMQQLPESVLETKTQVRFLMHAVEIVGAKINGSVNIFIELPRKDCSLIISTTTTASPPLYAPVFDHTFYMFSAKPNQLGPIGTVSARIEGSNATISYGLNIENEHLSPRITINAINGELQLQSYVSPGIYYYKITAQDVETSALTSVDTRLDVDSLIQCDGEQPQVANSLIIKYIEEEQEHKEVMNISQDGCEFQVFSMYPNDKAYVSINDTTKMLTTIAIDREDSIFANMLKPQIQVKLKLSCNTSTSQTSRQRRSADNYSLIFSQDMPFAKDVTMLTLIIVDINDNAPEFIYPLKPTHLGYPERNICLELFPEYLTQLKAFDRDEGLNAKIRYSMRTNAHFAIDPETGVIYPKANALQNTTAANTTLIVMATDRDGAPDGLSTGAELYVKRLSAEHFTLLTLRTTERQELQELLDDLAAKTFYQIESVKAATLPGNVTEVTVRNSLMRRYRRETLDDNTIIQKVWIYALEADKPVTSDNFKQRLASLTIPLTAETYAQVGLASNQTIVIAPQQPYEAPNASGYIAAISILSVALAFILCFLLWHFYLQKIYHARYTSQLSKFDNDSETTSSIEVQTKPNVQQFLGQHPDTEEYVKRASVGIIGSTTQESNSDEVKHSPLTVLTKDADSGVGSIVEDVSQPRAQVKFNELVERIHIIVDPPEDEINEHEKEEEKSVYL